MGFKRVSKVVEEVIRLAESLRMSLEVKWLNVTCSSCEETGWDVFILPVKAARRG